jgi:hypothetical protein
MSSVSSTSSGLSNLLQTLSAESPQLSSLLSTPKMQSALEKASPGDLVQLSDQALQLQQVGLLFGSSNSTQSTSDSLFSMLSPGSSNAEPDPIIQALESSLGAGGSSSAGTPIGGQAASTSASPSQIASATSNLQAQ